jgi:hypothetical protein
MLGKYNILKIGSYVILKSRTVLLWAMGTQSAIFGSEGLSKTLISWIKKHFSDQRKMLGPFRTKTTRRHQLKAEITMEEKPEVTAEVTA